MKKILKYIFLVLIFIPLVVFAKTDKVKYNDGIKSISKFINDSVFNDKQKYLLFDNVEYLEDNSLFKNGGYLSVLEYEISKVGNSSYLSPGIEYWTLTSDGVDKKKCISTVVISKSKENDSSYVRATEFVKKGTRVKGLGTYSKPWEFIRLFTVQLKTNDIRFGTINNVEGFKKTVDEGDNVSFRLYSNIGYKYDKTEGCTIEYESDNNYKISNVKNDIICLVKFDERVYRYHLDENPSPNILYLKYSNGWYSDSKTQNSIDKITPPTKEGYKFLGYYTKINVKKYLDDENEEGQTTGEYELIEEEIEIIDEDGNILDGNLELPEDNEINKYLYSKWELNSASIIVNGAVLEKITYVNKSDSSITGTIERDAIAKSSVNLSPGTYIFTSNVAVSKSDLNEPYKKEIEVTSETDRIDFYPEGAVYWYGNGGVSGSSLYSVCGGIHYKYNNTKGTYKGTLTASNSNDRVTLATNSVYVYTVSRGGEYMAYANCNSLASMSGYTKVYFHMSNGGSSSKEDPNNNYNFARPSIELKDKNFDTFAYKSYIKKPDGHIYNFNVSKKFKPFIEAWAKCNCGVSVSMYAVWRE